jgi:predicted TIM-barrel fold metal-dependent hydrolase
LIIDGHAYCFPPWDTPAGYGSVEEKMRLFQGELGIHHQPVWRVRDRAPADNSTLVDPATLEPRDVEWTHTQNRFAWTYDGETYTKQYFPPMLHNLECPPELLIAEMDYAGVDMAILHHSPHLGFLNSFLADAVRRYPSRLLRLIGLRDAEIPLDPGTAIRAVEREVGAGGCCGFQFMPRSYYEGGSAEPWDDGRMRPFWQALAALGLPVYFTFAGVHLGQGKLDAEKETYLEQHRILTRWMDRYPGLTTVITHGLPWLSHVEDDRIRLPEAVWDVFEAPQCNLHLLFPISLGGVWDYPWKQTESTVRECVDRIGADRLIWGTDMPMVARFCTYRQTLDQYRLHCDFLSDEERAAILGGTAARVAGVDGARAG